MDEDNTLVYYGSSFDVAIKIAQAGAILSQKLLFARDTGKTKALEETLGNHFSLASKIVPLSSTFEDALEYSQEAHKQRYVIFCIALNKQQRIRSLRDYQEKIDGIPYDLTFSRIDTLTFGPGITDEENFTLMRETANYKPAYEFMKEQ